MSGEKKIVLVTEEYLETLNFTCPHYHSEGKLFVIDSLAPDSEQGMGQIYCCDICGDSVAAVASSYVGEELQQEILEKGPIEIAFDLETIELLLEEEFENMLDEAEEGYLEEH